jgi:hypothetical protein
MSDPTPAPLVREYDMLLAHPTEARVLLLPGAEGWHLPARRTEENNLFGGSHIRAALAAQLGADCTVLHVAHVYVDPETQRWRWALIAVENHDPAWTPPDGARWTDAAALADLPLAQPEQRAAILSWLVERAGDAIPAQRAPWARPGWLNEITAWAAGELARNGRALTGPLEQVKTWAISCLLRAPASGGTVYIKACPVLPLFTNEPAFTARLAELYPRTVPRPLAVDPAWRWMLLDEFAGPLLKDAPRPAWDATIRAFAAMQRESVGQIDALLAAGCLDRRLDRLASAVPALLAALDERDGLDPAEIAALRAAEGRLVALCAELASYRVPPALLHGDLHENNIAIAATGPLIFDWSDACIAHPFLDLVTLLDPEGTPLAPDERARLRDLYLSYWTGYEPLERLRAVAALAEPVGLLHQTLSYEQIMAGVEPGARWQYAWGFRYFARRLLAALADPAAAAW